MKLEHILMASLGVYLFMKNKESNATSSAPQLPSLPDLSLPELPQATLPEQGQYSIMPMPALPPVQRQPATFVQESPAPSTSMDPKPVPQVVPLAPVPKADVSFSFSEPTNKQSVGGSTSGSRLIIPIAGQRKGEYSIPRREYIGKDGRKYIAW